MKKILLSLVWLLTAMYLTADIPAKTEQFIYSMEVFNGIGYDTATFCTTDSDTIYLVADVVNFIQPRKSLVYFWPPADQWQLDIEHLYEPLSGSLHITDNKKTTKDYQLTTYTFSMQSGVYEEQWQTFLGNAAETTGTQFTALLNAYTQLYDKYQNDLYLYQQYTDLIIEQINRQRAAGKDVTSLVKQVENLKAPEKPAVPDYYVYPLRQAFAVNLPVGEYTIRFENSAGLIMEGSEKKLIVFDKRRTNGIGYEILPGDKWTLPEYSYTPSSVVYVDGTTDLYFKPFFENEYNDLYYNKMINNQSRGNQQLYRWEQIRQVPDARLEFTSSTGTARVIMEQPYIVEQATGTAAGYTIAAYDPVGVHKNQTANFKGFHIPISAKAITIQLQSKENKNYQLSVRQIRIIKKNNPLTIPAILTFLPIVIYCVSYLIRRKKTSQTT